MRKSLFLLLIGALILVTASVSPASALEGRIVFSPIDAQGNQDIYIMNANGSGQTRLTTNPATDQNPSLSGDHRVVFSSERTGDFEIWIMNDNGGGQTQLTNSAGGDYYPMLSPDGSKIVFYSSRDGNWEIYLMDDDGSNPIRLTNNLETDEDPCFSPDGSRIIFTSNRDGNEEIYIMNRDGTNQVNLTNNPGSNDSYPKFSPDGSKITFTSNRDGNNEVYIMDVDGSHQTRLTANTVWDGYSSFSPDGTRLAFLANRIGGWNIWTMNIDGSSQTQITTGAMDYEPRFGPPEPPSAPTNLAGSAVSANQIDLSWTDQANNELGFKVERKTGVDGVLMILTVLGPNITSYQDAGLAPNTTYYYRVSAYNAGGSSYSSEVGVTTTTSPSPGLGRIVFDSYDATGNHDVYIMSADGSGETRLTTDPAEDWMPFLSADGRVVFCSNRSGDLEVWIMNADGTNQTQLTNAVKKDYLPAVSPDGSKIAFQSERDGNWEIYIMNSDGSGQTRLTNNTANDQEPTFSPDSTKIIFTSNRNGNNDIYVMGIDGQGVTALISNPASDYYPFFSPQGDRITFTSTRDGNDEIYLANFDGSNPIRITNHTVRDIYSSFSPDGSRLSFLSYRHAGWNIWTMNTDGSGLTMLTFDGNNYKPVYGPSVLAEAPKAPTNLVAQAVSGSQINLSWTDNSDNETGFKIERKTGVGGTYNQIATVSVNVTTYQNSGLSPTTAYYYRVRAYNTKGDSLYSNEASDTTPGAEIPNAPTNLTATAISSSQINLAWTDNSDTEVGFKIERKTGVGGTYDTIAIV
ncbi:MAG: DUF5050 domain-containing protein, partial [bacterium]